MAKSFCEPVTIPLETMRGLMDYTAGYYKDHATGDALAVWKEAALLLARNFDPNRLRHGKGFNADLLEETTGVTIFD